MGRRQAAAVSEAQAGDKASLLRSARPVLGLAMIGLGVGAAFYWLSTRMGMERLKEWIPKISITREPEVTYTDVHRNGHSQDAIGGLRRI